MPYTIHIPIPYQSRTYIFPPSYTTTATSISISTASPLSLAIYTDAQVWGWNTSHEPMSTYDRTRWAEYTALATRNGWFRDLFAIWQREHGIRIAAAAGGVPRTRMQMVRDFANWWRMRTLKGRGAATRELEGKMFVRGLIGRREREVEDGEEEGSLDIDAVERMCGLTGEEEEGELLGLSGARTVYEICPS